MLRVSVLLLAVSGAAAVSLEIASRGPVKLLRSDSLVEHRKTDIETAESPSYCVYTRAFFDDGYIAAFISHYLKLGFNRIIMLKTDGIPYTLDSKYQDRVHMQYVNDTQTRPNKLLSTFSYLIKRSGCDWCLSVDSDEFLITDDDHIHDYVQRAVSQKPGINIIWFRWGMMDRFDDDNLGLGSSIQTYKINRNKHIKSMFLVSNLGPWMHSHVVGTKEPAVVYLNGEVHYHNKNKYFLSLPVPSVYTDYLLHVHTRSISNLLTKALLTHLPNKAIGNEMRLLKYINTLAFNKDDRGEIFKDIVNAKAKLAFKDESAMEIDYRGKRHAALISDSLPLGKDTVTPWRFQGMGLNVTAFHLMVKKLAKNAECTFRRC